MYVSPVLGASVRVKRVTQVTDYYTKRSMSLIQTSIDLRLTACGHNGRCPRAIRFNRNLLAIFLASCVTFLPAPGLAGEFRTKNNPVDWDQSKEYPEQIVPYGKNIPRKEGVVYYVASGEQECEMCRRIVNRGRSYGRSFPNLCENELEQAEPMCKAQQRVLQGCPEFANDWCYHDLGGTQRLLSPCPTALKCHYCLGLNPLHCIRPGEYAR